MMMIGRILTFAKQVWAELSIVHDIPRYTKTSSPLFGLIPMDEPSPVHERML